jgi:hypothetical protein
MFELCQLVNLIAQQFRHGVTSLGLVQLVCELLLKDEHGYLLHVIRTTSAQHDLQTHSTVANIYLYSFTAKTLHSTAPD